MKAKIHFGSINTKGEAFQKVLKCILHPKTKEEHLPALNKLIDNFRKVHNDSYLYSWLYEELLWKKLTINVKK